MREFTVVDEDETRVVVSIKFASEESISPLDVTLAAEIAADELCAISGGEGFSDPNHSELVDVFEGTTYLASCEVFVEYTPRYNAVITENRVGGSNT